MTAPLDAIRAHLAAGAALLQQLDGGTAAVAATPAGDEPFSARMGLEIDAEAFAELVELGARMGLAPSLVLKLALEALEQAMARPRRMVGKERGLLEGKR